jgi:hypothetical protein
VGDVAVVVVGALLMATSGVVHIHLWDIAYRHVATLGSLFLVQAVAALLGAVALGATRRLFVVAGSVALMVGTIIGFILADTVGLFGFTLRVVTGWASLALASEALSAAVLTVVAVRARRQA